MNPPSPGGRHIRSVAFDVRIEALLRDAGLPVADLRAGAAMPRAQAPAAIAQTTQFSSLCPSSSAFLRKALTRPC